MQSGQDPEEGTRGHRETSWEGSTGASAGPGGCWPGWRGCTGGGWGHAVCRRPGLGCRGEGQRGVTGAPGSTPVPSTEADGGGDGWGWRPAPTSAVFPRSLPPGLCSRSPKRRPHLENPVESRNLHVLGRSGRPPRSPHGDVGGHCGGMKGMPSGQMTAWPVQLAACFRGACQLTILSIHFKQLEKKLKKTIMLCDVTIF